MLSFARTLTFCTTVVLIATTGARSSADDLVIRLWHGAERRVGHFGDLQDDFNITGHVEGWKELDRLQYRINGGHPVPLCFRAFRRLESDGDFNADVPVGMLRPGVNVIIIEGSRRDGRTVRQEVRVLRVPPDAKKRLPLRINWSGIRHVDDAGLAVDGEWQLTPQGLRTARPGYDRLFLIGDRRWRDYEVHTTVTIHAIQRTTPAYSGGAGVGILLRFAGHVTGGPRHFPSGQPKWGYQPFGAIGWLRWRKDDPQRGPALQFYRGDVDSTAELGAFLIREGESVGLRFGCETLADENDGKGVTRYRFRAWKLPEPEPQAWSWTQVQTSSTALRRGGFALLAHHVDATFGDVIVHSPAAPRGGKSASKR